ncbi:MAG: dethiobiotin synthase [Phenylobacterium sp.]|uniref:dethiobiotin synthase n=1 Tax=Phenylobacterium sp. TaxID=1871053 RepID=UPI0027206FDC|nr:dethiobiotin synthase [Phenylobacterium sp.]MDO8901513.1 dethiobiotin synthase [Phenylobacterium sp.]MDP2214436.1 dethiobiotin synthase [Phenylobacterium sp.]
MRALFVAGAHTDVGKTYAACALIAAALARGLSVEAFKPAVSGIDPADWGDSDPGRLLAALGRPLTEAALEAMSPLRFAAALSPPMAARREGRDLRLQTLVSLCQTALAASSPDLMLIEGAGGVMSPLSEDATNLDLMAALGLPIILVGGSYLGAISHTLTAAKVIQGEGLTLAAVVISQDAAPDAPDFAETISDVARFLPGVRVIPAPRGGQDWAGALI